MTEENRLSPPVYWAERKNLVYVFFHVIDCKKPEIKLEKDKLYFRGKSENSEYEVTLNFFKEVNPEKSRFAVRERGVDFVLIKSDEGPYWQKLLQDTKKHHWLRVDFDKWRDEDDSDAEVNDETDFDAMMKQMGGLQASDNNLEDLEESDDDEDDEQPLP